MNLFIYIVIRDEKLLQLRDKIEAASLQGSGAGFLKGRVVQFLFKIGQQHGFDFNWCLDQIRDLESEVYLPLNKIAKELGLKESHQYMLQIFNSEENAANSLEHQAQWGLANGLPEGQQLTAQALAHMIKTDFDKWHKLLCSSDHSTHVSPQEVALVTFDAIAGYLLPRELQQSSKANQLQNYLSESLYVLEQPFLEQVKYLASATRSGAAGG